MADEKKILAKKAFDLVRTALDERKWVYNTDEENLHFDFKVSGDDLPMQMIIRIDDERQLIRVFSMLPFDMAEDKRIEGAIAVCVANCGMVDGGFDYNLNDGSILFRNVATYRDSDLSATLVQYLISVCCSTVDKYNDRFLMLSKGMLSLEAFIQKDKA